MIKKKILMETKAVWLRFFGKIFGRKSDYYVIYGNLKNFSTEAEGNIEKPGKEGLNRFTFWASNSSNTKF